MPDPQQLGEPFDRLVEVLELVAQASGGYVAFDTTIRGRRSGNTADLAAAVYIGAEDNQRVYAVDCDPGARATGVAAVDDIDRKRKDILAVGCLLASAKGFTRAARHRAEQLEVPLVDLSASPAEWPRWLTSGSFTTADLHWRVRNVNLPRVRGVPPNILEGELRQGDALFENPEGRKFTADQLFRRWCANPGNEDLILSELEGARERLTRTVPLQFDRPMKILANTVRELPMVRGASFDVEFWAHEQVIPLRLFEDAATAEGEPRFSLVSGAVSDGQGVQRLRLVIATDAETGERHVIFQSAVPDGQSPAEDESGD